MQKKETRKVGGHLFTGISESCLNAFKDLSEKLQTKNDTAGLEGLSEMHTKANEEPIFVTREKPALLSLVS